MHLQWFAGREALPPSGVCHHRLPLSSSSSLSSITSLRTPLSFPSVACHSRLLNYMTLFSSLHMLGSFPCFVQTLLTASSM